MKLAEALQERADLNRKIEQIRTRLSAVCLVQEGEQPAEDPQMLKKELDSALDRLEFISAHINLTNANTIIEGKSLTEHIALRDMFTLKISAYRHVTETASQSTYRARNSEIKIKPSISVGAWQNEIDVLSKSLRLLDNMLQENNWKTELIE